MGILWRLLAPPAAKRARRVMHPVRRARRAVEPRPVRRVRRQAWIARHPAVRPARTSSPKSRIWTTRAPGHALLHPQIRVVRWAGPATRRTSTDDVTQLRPLRGAATTLDLTPSTTA